MEESEIVTKIAECQARLKQNEVEQSSNFANDTKLDMEIKRLKAELTEAKKPKLRHGQLVGSGHYGPCIIIGNGRKAKGYDSLGNSIDPEIKGVSSFGVLCEDIYKELDDLKAMQEEVTEFEQKCYNCNRDSIKFSIATQGRRFHLELGEESMYINTDSIPAFILKLRQMQATLRRQGAKQ